jgi:hypothetical protein
MEDRRRYRHGRPGAEPGLLGDQACPDGEDDLRVNLRVMVPVPVPPYMNSSSVRECEGDEEDRTGQDKTGQDCGERVRQGAVRENPSRNRRFERCQSSPDLGYRTAISLDFCDRSLCVEPQLRGFSDRSSCISAQICPIEIHVRK